MVHPFDSTAALIALLFGVFVAISLLTPDFVPSKSMDKMPGLVVVLVSGFLGTGGAVAITGLNWWGDNVSTGWALERFGWLLAAGGFITYSISVSWHYPESVFSWAIPLALGLGSALRALSIFFIERSVRSRIARVEGGAHE
jgi:hypothetical protein